MKTILLLFIFTVFSFLLPTAQITGSSNVCAGFIYTYSVNMPGAVSYSWTLPQGWYTISGQNTSSVTVDCDVNDGSICVTGYDSDNDSVSTLCTIVNWGGGSGWYVDGTQTGDCNIGFSAILNVQPDASCGSGGCGNGYQNPNVFFAAFDDVWPSGAYLGVVNGVNAFTDMSSLSTPVYVYEVDTTFGVMKLVTGGAAGCYIDNEYDLPPQTQIDYVYVTQQPDTACIGDTIVVYAQNYGGFPFNGGFMPATGVTIVSSTSDSAVIVITSTDATELFYGGGNGAYCPVTGQIQLAYTNCHSVPAVAFVAGDTALCANWSTKCVGFTDMSTNKPIRWKWSFPGGSPDKSSEQNPSVCYDSVGVYSVTLIASDGAGSDTITYNNYIHINPYPDITVTPDTAICIGSSVQLTAQGGLRYFWNPTNGNLNNDTIYNPVATPTHTTYYSVAGTNSYGCNEAAYVTVTVNALPIAHVSRDTSLCSGSIIPLSASGATYYSWKPSIGLSDSTIAKPFAHPSTTTTYTVTVSYNADCFDTASVTLTVFPAPPVPRITQSLYGDTLISSFDPSYMAYQWYDSITLLAGDTSRFCPINRIGKYTIEVTDTDGCKISASTNILILGIENKQNNGFVTIFPNPVKNTLSITIEEAAASGIRDSYIYNALGQVVQRSPLFLRATGLEADVSSLPSGIYFIEIIGEKQRWIGRFAKE